MAIRAEAGRPKKARVMNRILRPHHAAALRVCACISLVSLASVAVHGEWPEIPEPRQLWRTTSAYEWDADQDPQGMFGPTHLMAQTLAGLLANDAAARTGDDLIWVGMRRQGLRQGRIERESYQTWLDDYLARTTVETSEALEPWRLLEILMKAGRVDGYILYRMDRSDRPLYAAPRADTDESVNVATSLCASFRAVAIDESIETRATALGLKRLLDVRGKTERWCFETYRERFSRTAVCTQDPKVMHARDMAVAGNMLCVFGVDDFYEQVLAWMEPDSLALGWNAADEFRQTDALSRHGHYQTATNWCMNLPVLSSLQPGVHTDPAETMPGRASRLIPRLLEPNKDGQRYVSFVMSDGDNVQWLMGGFLYQPDRDYWDCEARGTFPLGWTLPAMDLLELCPPTLAHLGRTATANDAMIHLGGGYYYPDRFGLDRDTGLLRRHARRVAKAMRASGLSVLMVNCQDWKSEASARAFSVFAEEIHPLLGILAIQYSPYPGGAGDIRWVSNGRGAEVPVVSCRWALWANAGREREGSPSEVAQSIIRGEGKTISREFDAGWCVAHAWSYFAPPELAGTPAAENIDQTRASLTPGARRGVAPIVWCAEQLTDPVSVVSPQEMLLRIRLRQRAESTLLAYAESLNKHLEKLRREPRQVAELLTLSRETEALIELIQAGTGTTRDIWEQLVRLDAKIESARLSMIDVQRYGELLEVRLPGRARGIWTVEPWDISPAFPRADEVLVRSGSGIVAHWTEACSGRVDGLSTADRIQVRCRADDVWGSWVALDIR